MLRVFRVNLVARKHRVCSDVHCLSLKSWRGAVSTPEFLIFNDKVIGCEFLGERDVSGEGVGGGAGGGRLFVEHHGGSGQPPAQTVTYTQRTLCGSLESAGLLQWLVFATVPKGIAMVSPHPSHLT